MNVAQVRPTKSAPGNTEVCSGREWGTLPSELGALKNMIIVYVS